MLLFGKSTDPYAERAIALAGRHARLTARVGTRHDPLPADVGEWSGGYIVSYLSPWIVPPTLLARASIAALNFHPGPPEYPGIGCTNFALYAGARTYGVTCHHMAPSVDSGAIVAVRRFPIEPADTVLSLTQRCHAAIADLFADVLGVIARGEPLPSSGDRWTRRPFRRAELDALCRLSPDMPDDELRRRIRATTYPNMPGPYVEVDGARVPVTEVSQVIALRGAVRS
jgi:methionyl-tRNA formyltransferase